MFYLSFNIYFHLTYQIQCYLHFKIKLLVLKLSVKLTKAMEAINQIYNKNVSNFLFQEEFAQQSLKPALLSGKSI